MSGKVDTWMPLYVGDYDNATSRLTLAEDGAYLRLIRDYWKNGAPPDDDATLARILRIERREWMKIRPVLEPFFTVENGRWTHDRVERELERARAVSEARREAGAKGGRPKKQEVGDADPKAIAKPIAKPIAVANEVANEKQTAKQSGLQNETPSPSHTSDEVIEKADAFSVVSAEPTTTGEGKAWSKDPDFVAAWDACTPLMRTRAKSRDKVWPEWKKAKAKAGGGPALLAALRRYIAKDPDVNRTSGPGLQRWLADGRWEHWLAADEPAQPAAPAWSGPADLWAAVSAEAGEPFARNYLAHCRWMDVPVRGLVPRNGFARDKLAQEVGRVLARFDVRLIEEDAA